MNNQTKGKVDTSLLTHEPEPHEQATADYFADQGYDVTFLRPRNIKGLKNPDFMMNGKIWEVKGPVGKSKRTFEDDLRKAMRQSSHIIIDLRRAKKISEKWYIDKLRRESVSPEIETMVVIRRSGGRLDIKGKV